MPMTYEQSQKIKFDRSSRINSYGEQVNDAVCRVCRQWLQTTGDPEGVTGIGELNRQVADHRREHRMYDVPPHAPRRD